MQTEFFKTKSHSYPMEKVDSSNSANFPCIVDKSHISLGWSVKLSDLNVSKAMKKFSPYLCSHAVANGQSDFVVFVIMSLHFHIKIQEIIKVIPFNWHSQRSWMYGLTVTVSNFWKMWESECEECVLLLNHTRYTLNLDFWMIYVGIWHYRPTLWSEYLRVN